MMTKPFRNPKPRRDRALEIACGWCGDKNERSLCARCYSHIPAPERERMRAAYKFGSPERAKTIGLEALDELVAASGLPKGLPPRKMTKEAP